MEENIASQAVSRGWEIFKKDPLRHIGIFFVMLIILGIFGYLGEKSAILKVLYYFILIIIGVFLLGYALDVVRGQYKDFNDTFKRYVNLSVIVNFVFYLILIGLAYFALMFPVILGSVAVGKLGLIFSIIGGIILFYLSLRLFFSQYFILDGQGLADAIQNSWKLSASYVGMILYIIAVSFFINLIGALALGIGLFVTIPITYFIQANFYVLATQNDEAENNLPEESAE